MGFHLFENGRDWTFGENGRPQHKHKFVCVILAPSFFFFSYYFLVWKYLAAGIFPAVFSILFWRVSHLAKHTFIILVKMNFLFDFWWVYSQKRKMMVFCLFLFLFATLKFNKTHVEITWAMHLSIFLMDHQKSCFYLGNQWNRDVRFFVPAPSRSRPNLRLRNLAW